MKKNNKQLVFWIAFPIGWTLLSALLIFLIDLVNGPLVWFILELLVLCSLFVVRVLIRRKRKLFKLLTWLGENAAGKRGMIPRSYARRI